MKSILELKAEMAEEVEWEPKGYYSKDLTDTVIATIEAQRDELRKALEYVASFSYAGGKSYGDLPIVKNALARSSK